MIRKVKAALRDHDMSHQGVFHQAMILCQTTDTINPISLFVRLYNENIIEVRDRCEQYISTTNVNIRNDFTDGRFRTIVICGSLLEGFDHRNVSVVGIIRNLRSKILFSQFVGRALRLIDEHDHLTAQIITDPRFGIREIWENYRDPVVGDDDDPDVND